MRILRNTRHLPFGSAALAAAALWWCSAGTAPAQRPGADPVEELRQALKIPVRGPAGNPDELKFRERNLQKAVASLRTIGDLRRALQLPAAWLDDELLAPLEVKELDHKYRAEIADRFRRDMRKVLQSADPLAQLAAADLIEGIGVSIRGSSDQDAGGLTRPLAPDLEALLRSREVSVRTAAARALGKMNPEPTAAAGALGGALKSPQQPEPVRRAAAKSLGDMIQVVMPLAAGKTVAGAVATKEDAITTVLAVVRAVRPGLTDPDPQVRRQSLEAVRTAAVALRDLVEERKAEDLPPTGRQWSKDEIEQVQGYRATVERERNTVMPIANALRELGPSLRATLQDPDEEIRLAATRALEEVGNAHMRLVRRYQSVPAMQPPISTSQAGIPNRLRPSELVVLRDKNDAQSAKAIVSTRLLVALQKPAAMTTEDPLLELIASQIPELAETLNDPNPRIRLTTMNVLEMLGSEAYRAEPLLLRATSDPNRFVRWSAARILGKTRPSPEAVPQLARLLSDRDLGVRTAAAATIEHYGDLARDAVPALTADVNRGDAEMREISIKTIASLGPDLTRSAIPALAQALSDRDVRVRRAAAKALGRYGPAARQAEPALRAALRHDDPEERRAVSEALLSILQQAPPARER